MAPTATFCAVALFVTALSSGVVAAEAAETAVVDRIEGDEAVLLVETDGRTSGQRQVDLEELPGDGRHEGAVLVPVGDEYVYDASATERRTSAADERFDELADGGGDGGGGCGLCRFGLLGRIGVC